MNALTYIHIADSIRTLKEKSFYRFEDIPLSGDPCKIYISAEFEERIRNMFCGRSGGVEFIENELDWNEYVLK